MTFRCIQLQVFLVLSTIVLVLCSRQHITSTPSVHLAICPLVSPIGVCCALGIVSLDSLSHVVVVLSCLPTPSVLVTFIFFTAWCSSLHHLYTPPLRGLKISASCWVMLRETDILFCLWIYADDSFCIELMSFSYRYFRFSNVCLRGCCIFLPLHSCLFFMFNHNSLKVQTVTAAPDTSWCVFPVYTNTSFLGITCHFYIEQQLR